MTRPIVDSEDAARERFRELLDAALKPRGEFRVEATTWNDGVSVRDPSRDDRVVYCGADPDGDGIPGAGTPIAVELWTAGGGPRGPAFRAVIDRPALWGRREWRPADIELIATLVRAAFARP